MEERANLSGTFLRQEKDNKIDEQIDEKHAKWLLHNDSMIQKRVIMK